MHYFFSAILLILFFSSNLIHSQEYGLHRGQNGRVGRNEKPQAESHPGFGRFTWNDVASLGSTLVNHRIAPGPRDEDGNVPDQDDIVKTSGWSFLSIDAPQPARDDILDFEINPYLFTRTVRSASSTNLTSSGGGALQTFTWIFKSKDGFTIEEDERFEIHIGIPAGPTNGLSPQRFFAYKVSGVAERDQVFIIDTQWMSNSVDPDQGEEGGYYQLGDTFTATGDEIRVTLYNTFVARPGQNDSEAPGETLVYAGAALLKKQDLGSGTYQASPVISKLSTVLRGTAWRIVAAKNEHTHHSVGENDAQVGIVTSYLHDGRPLITSRTSSQDLRQNIVWSWPVPRPLGIAADDAARKGAFESYADRRTSYARSQNPANITSLRIESTPVQARLSSGTDVVVIAREDGKIFCLDAFGTLGTDGVPTGETTVLWETQLPQGFGLSSGLIQSIEGNEFLFIGNKDGQVRKIDLSNGSIVAMSRLAQAANTLAPIVGSVAYTEFRLNGATNLTRLIIVPTVNKGIVALSAEDLSQVWAFTEGVRNGARVPVGAVWVTPAVEFGKIYFGDGNGNMFAIRQEDGAAVWGPVPSQTDTEGGSSGAQNPFSVCSPATVPSSELILLDEDRVEESETGIGSGLSATQADTVYFADDEGVVYALNAETGAEIWRSADDLSEPPSGAISFTRLIVSTESGTQFSQAAPVILIPTDGGEVLPLFAHFDQFNEGTANLNGGAASPAAASRLASWDNMLNVERVGRAALTSVAVGGEEGNDGATFPDDAVNHSTLVYGDETGNLLAFSHQSNVNPDGPVSPGSPGSPDRKASTEILREIVEGAEIGFLTESDYMFILAKYKTYTADDVKSMSKKITRRIFEFGEPIFMVLYNLNSRKLSDFSGFTSRVTISSHNISGRRRTLKSGGFVYLYRFVPDCLSAKVPPRIGQNLLRIQLSYKGRSRYARLPMDKRRIYLAHPIAMSIVEDAPTIFSENSPADALAQLPSNKALGTFIDLKDLLTEDENLGRLRDQILANENGRSFGIKEKELGLVPEDEEYLFLQTFSKKDIMPATQPLIPHGKVSQTRIYIWDRSLMAMHRPKTPLPVKFVLKDLEWYVPESIAELDYDDPEEFMKTHRGVTNPLPNRDRFGLYEDPPDVKGNRSLDYPNISKGTLRVFQETYGQRVEATKKEIKLFQSILVEKDFSSPDQFYEIYNSGIPRNLVATTVSIDIDVPRFQPPCRYGYRGRKMQVFLVLPSENAKNQNRPSQVALMRRPKREFALEAHIEVDKSMKVTTPILDFKALPSGSGMTALGTELPSPSMPFKVENVGNVNLLNIRVAKGFAEGSLWIEGKNMSKQVRLAAPEHLISSMDEPLLGNTPFGSQVFLQKPRVGSRSGRELVLFPKYEIYPKSDIYSREEMYPKDGSIKRKYPEDEDFLINHQGTPFMFPDGEKVPELGLRIPVGTPVGDYSMGVKIVENDPVDGPIAAEPPVEVRFKVIENQLTGSTLVEHDGLVKKNTVPMIDAPIRSDANKPTDTQPAVFRDRSGTLHIGWVSNRDGAWKIYTSYLKGKSPEEVTGIEGPLRDLDGFERDSRLFNGEGSALLAPWFSKPQSLQIESSVASFFDGEVIPESLQCGSPVFSYSEEGADPKLYMGLVCEATVKVSNNKNRTESKVCLLQLKQSSEGSLEIAHSFVIPSQIESKKSRPAIVAVGNSVLVFYAVRSTGSGGIYIHRFDGSSWRALGHINFPGVLEEIGAPAALLRKSTGKEHVDLFFSARLKGKEQSEIYYQGFNLDGNDISIARVKGFLQEPLQFDSKRNVFWVSGSKWDLNPHSKELEVDLLDGKKGTSLLKKESQKFNELSGILTFDTVLGGKVFLDTLKGMIRFSDAFIPQDSNLLLMYRPAMYRLSQGVFHQRSSVHPCVVYDDTSFPRYILAYTGRNLEVGSSSTLSSRPYYQSFRFGIQLSDSFDSKSIKLQDVLGNQLSSKLYQTDSKKGRIYVDPSLCGTSIDISYMRISKRGETIGDRIYLKNRIVSLVSEMDERAIPIHGAYHEESFCIGLDPKVFVSTVQKRPRLLWVVYGSTRNGARSLYMQSIAPDYKGLNRR